ncbi:MAG: YbfB/YjiJ family MFS transporter [Variovorax sp.]|nr:YbfB/YjiJ family MFS transporter [Variovorax sp.]
MSNLSVAVARPSYLSVCVAGLLALAIAMGIGRFAFTPMLPLMIRAGSLDVAAGGWLAAANYAGYLLGALTTARLPLSPSRVGLVALAAIVLSTAAMGWSGSVAVWLVLRFVAGVASAWALVSTSVWCLAWLARLGRPAGAGILYAGVGAGIALAGLYCWRAGAAQVPPGSLWVQLGVLALAGLAAVAVLMPRDSAAEAAPGPHAGEGAAASGEVPWGLVLSYGMLGLGYILPATFLPVLARAVVDDPSVFGAAWPVFGAAAAASTLLAAAVLGHVSRRRVLAGSHVLMAVGCLLPVVHLSALTVLAAALLVGGTFMVATMAGMQEAKARASGDPTRALGRMTAAFAIGQMAGPILSSALSGTAQGFGGLFIALGVSAAALLGSAAWLVRDPPSNA